jgi:hypothetical protein
VPSLYGKPRRLFKSFVSSWKEELAVRDGRGKFVVEEEVGL